jgi:hypothetical protein
VTKGRFATRTSHRNAHAMGALSDPAGKSRGNAGFPRGLTVAACGALGQPGKICRVRLAGPALLAEHSA